MSTARTVKRSDLSNGVKKLDPIEEYGFDPYVYRWNKRRCWMMLPGHIPFFYGIYTLFTCATYTTATFWFMWISGWFTGLGVTAGAHRLWAHRAYKATLPLRIFLAYCFCMSNQEDLYTWVRNHRIHHKHTDTDRDPHNSTRGFFFCHSGWLFSYPHPEVLRERKKTEMSDIWNDPVARFESRFHSVLTIILCYFIPTVIPYYLWNEDIFVAFSLNVLRFGLTLHATSCINSVAHYFGEKPYDKHATSTDSMWTNMIILGLGEGWHNYHHVFPHDYRTSEFPYFFNLSTIFIDIMAFFGLAYDLKWISQPAIDARKEKNKLE